MKKTSKLKVFETHGVEFTHMSGNQSVGNCPFSGKRDKFYVNNENFLWDSKVTGDNGNVTTFLELIAKQNAEGITARYMTRLAEDRGLPYVAFRKWQVGYDGTQYTFPVFGLGGRATDIRRYCIGGKVRSTAGCSTGLMGGELLARTKSSIPVFICEGDWDTIALRYLTNKVKKEFVVVGVPGASVFKAEWVEAFKGRTVYVVYDNDEAGESGELRVLKRLKDVVRKIRFVHWPESASTGYDIRDWILHGAIKRKTPRRCFNTLVKMCKPYPRRSDIDDSEAVDIGEEANAKPKRESSWTKPATYQEVVGVFDKWLYLDNHQGIEITLAVALSQRVQGDPVWMFLIAPPGGGKTETIVPLAGHEDTYMTSSVTTHALISGATYKNGADPSLIPKLDGKVFLIKDFTAILSMRDADKDEIFGILRDAYDGRCGKDFGTGVRREYESRFTILAAVTPRIYEIATQHQSLGERFLKFCMGDNIRHTHEEDIIGQAISNIKSDEQMKWELTDVVTSFLTYEYDDDEIPTLSPKYIKRIIALAKFAARLRGTVSRDRFRHDILIARPSAEIGSRVGKQLAKLAISVAMVHRRLEINERDYTLVKKCALDTIPQRSEDIVKLLHQSCETIDDMMTTRDISRGTKYPVATVARMLADMHILGIVARAGKRNRFDWTLSEYIRSAIKVSRLYTTHEELHRVTPTVEVRRVKKYKTRKDKGTKRKKNKTRSRHGESDYVLP